MKKLSPKKNNIDAFLRSFFLEIVVESNTTPPNRLVRWGLPPFINTLSDHLIFDVRVLTRPSRVMLIIIVKSLTSDMRWHDNVFLRVSNSLKITLASCGYTCTLTCKSFPSSLTYDFSITHWLVYFFFLINWFDFSSHNFIHFILLL